jgi:transcriptional regulator with XRE-family HTH domain
MSDKNKLAQEIGRRLREARLARGEDLDQVARDRFIPAPYLAALEQGALEQIPGRSYPAILVRAYGNHLGLDGAALAEPLLLAVSLAPSGPEPPGLTGGLRPRAAVTMAAFLLLTVAASVTSYALPQLRPDMTEAEPSIVVLEARDEAEWTGGALLATGAPATIPSPVSVPEADKADPNEGHPLASEIAVPELLGVTSQPAAVQPVVELALVPPTEAPTAYDEQSRAWLFGVDSAR